MSYLDKLNKKDLDRHFPNKSHGGKGSHARVQTKESRLKYLNGYDGIKWGTLKDNDTTKQNGD